VHYNQMMFGVDGDLHVVADEDSRNNDSFRDFMASGRRPSLRCESLMLQFDPST